MEWYIDTYQFVQGGGTGCNYRCTAKFCQGNCDLACFIRW